MSHENFSRPCLCRALLHSLFLPVAAPSWARGPDCEGAAKALGTSGCRVNVRALLLIMKPGEMDAEGMFVWAGILAVVGVAASYGIALWWQRWRASRKDG